MDFDDSELTWHNSMIYHSKLMGTAAVVHQYFGINLVLAFVDSIDAGLVVHFGYNRSMKIRIRYG